MQMSRIVCRNCLVTAPEPYDQATDDEEQFDLLLAEVRAKEVKCPFCGGHKWIRKVAWKV
jgi:hypothetical protein